MNEPKTVWKAWGVCSAFEKNNIWAIMRADTFYW